jgi:ATP-dependent Clp protease ATP-binding subunit ClpA
MFERFTNRARKVMALANQEAQRLNHDYIGTEHILLGMVNEGSGVGAQVLKSLKVDLRNVRQEVEKRVKRRPEMIAMSRLPQTPSAKRVIEHAIEQARDLGHKYVGTEHMLLGLLCEQNDLAAKVLMSLGLKLEDIREQVLSLLGAGIPAPIAPSQPLDDTPDQSHQRVERIPTLCAELLSAIRAAKESQVRDADYERASHLRELQNEFESFAKRLNEALTKLTE